MTSEDQHPGACQYVFDPGSSQVTFSPDRGALRTATAMRRGSASLNEIGMGNTVTVLIAIPRSAFATTAFAPQLAISMAGDSGDDNPRRFHRQ